MKKTREEMVELMICEDMDGIFSAGREDEEFLYAVLSGEGWKPYIQLSDEEIEVEYLDRLNVDEELAIDLDLPAPQVYLASPPEMIVIKNEGKCEYILDYADMDETDLVSQKRIFEYAQNRLEANEEERSDLDFDTFNMSTEQAIKVIRSFGETVEEFHRNKIIDDVLNKKLSGIDCVEDICDHMLFNNEIKDYADYLVDVQERYEDLALGLDAQVEYLNFDNEIREAKIMFVENNVINGNMKDAGEFLAENNMSINDIDIDGNYISIVAEHMANHKVEQVRQGNKTKRAEAKDVAFYQTPKV